MCAAADPDADVASPAWIKGCAVALDCAAGKDAALRHEERAAFRLRVFRLHVRRYELAGEVLGDVHGEYQRLRVANAARLLFLSVQSASNGQRDCDRRTNVAQSREMRHG